MKRYLQLHTATVHEKVKPNSKCDKCGISFGRKDNLQKHTASVHEKLRNFKCEKGFSINTNWEYICIRVSNNGFQQQFMKILNHTNVMNVENSLVRMVIYRNILHQFMRINFVKGSKLA